MKKFLVVVLIATLFCGAVSFAGENGKGAQSDVPMEPKEQKGGDAIVGPDNLDQVYQWNRVRETDDEENTYPYNNQPDAYTGHWEGYYFDFLVKPTGSDQEIQHSWFYLETYDESMGWEDFLAGMIPWDGGDAPENAAYFVHAIRLVDIGDGIQMMPERVLWQKCYVYEMVEDELVLIKYLRMGGEPKAKQGK